MARVLCISSQTVFGPVGNSAAVPALQALGHEVMQIPTVLLSHHPGLGKPAGQSTSVELLEQMFVTLHAVGAFNNLAAVMTGYFTSVAQVIAVTKQITILQSLNPQLHVLVDPVIGDHGRLYVADDVAEVLRDQLLPIASITTPNLFELTWLARSSDVGAAISSLSVPEIIVTSMQADDSHLATELHHGGRCFRHIIKRQSQVPNGTGDYLAGCYLSERLHHPADIAFASTMLRVEKTVINSLGAAALQLS